MDGIGLDNMLGAEQLEKMFGEGNAQEEPQEQNSGEETPENNENNETEETAEVDFSDLLGNQPESVGSGEHTEGNGETPESEGGPGTPQTNLFSSIAKATRDEGVFPDLSDDELKDVKDAASFKKMLENQIAKRFDDRQKRLEQALNSGASTDELKDYQNALNLSQYLERKNVIDTLNEEGDNGDTLRKQMMYEAYTKVHHFKHDKAVKLIEKSFSDGTDIDDAKEAFESCKEFYKGQVEDYNQEFENRKKEHEANEQKQYSNLKKNILDKETFFDGVKVDKQTRQKAYDSITKPIYRDEQGNYMNELQKFQREHPIEYTENVALLYALTDGFKNVNKLINKKVQQGVKKGFEEVANVLNTTRRNGDGTLNLANSAPDTEDRENWTLA